MPFSSKKIKKASDDKKRELIKKVYELGLEVGYHKHFEMGWVSERYNQLFDEATEYGLEKEIEEYYEKGKLDGEEKKEKDVAYVSSRPVSLEVKPLKEGEKIIKAVEKEIGESAEIEPVKHERIDHIAVEQIPAKKPDVTSPPKFFERIEVIDLPPFIEIFKLFKKPR